VREWSPDGWECRIVFSQCPASQLADVLREERERADASGYGLEWKVYGHDGPPGLTQGLRAAGFEAGAEERVLVLELDDTALRAFGPPACEVRVVHDAAGLPTWRRSQDRSAVAMSRQRHSGWRRCCGTTPAR
jgi:hypothetical protein